MLVYVRDDWCGELLKPVKEIPETNLDRLPQLLEKSPWNAEAPLAIVHDDNVIEVDVIQQEVCLPLYKTLRDCNLELTAPLQHTHTHTHTLVFSMSLYLLSHTHFYVFAVVPTIHLSFFLFLNLCTPTSRRTSRRTATSTSARSKSHPSGLSSV